MIIKKEQNYQYMIIDHIERMDAFALQMVTENKIPCLIACRQQVFNGEGSLYYDITGKRPLADRSVRLSGQQLQSLLQGLFLAAEALPIYFLSVDGISFDPDTVFEENGEWYFCYIPEREEQSTPRWDSVRFAEELLGKIDREDERAVVLVYQFYQMVRRQGDTLHHILSQLLYEGMETQKKGDFCSVTGGIEAAQAIQENKGMEGGSMMGEQADSDSAEAAPDENAPVKTDMTALVLFVLLGAVSAGFGVYTMVRLQTGSILELLAVREGILSVVFFVLSVLGVAGSCLPAALGRYAGRRQRGQRDDGEEEKEEVFEVPPIMQRR